MYFYRIKVNKLMVNCFLILMLQGSNKLEKEFMSLVICSGIPIKSFYHTRDMRRNILKKTV